MAIAFESIRVGKRYRLRNYDEVFDFTAVERLESDNFLLKDLYSLELYQLHELIRYGRGKDYDLYELD
jgi:hypothetical protein